MTNFLLPESMVKKKPGSKIDSDIDEDKKIHKVLENVFQVLDV